MLFHCYLIMPNIGIEVWKTPTLERVGATADHPEECVPVHSIDELSGNARASAITMAGPHL